MISMRFWLTHSDFAHGWRREGGGREEGEEGVHCCHCDPMYTALASMPVCLWKPGIEANTACTIM